MGGIISSIGSVVSTTQSPKPGASHLCRDLAGCPAIGFGLIPESIPPLGGGSRPGLVCCPQVIGRGEEAGEGDSCLSGGEMVWVVNQDKI